MEITTDGVYELGPLPRGERGFIQAVGEFAGGVLTVGFMVDFLESPTFYPYSDLAGTAVALTSSGMVSIDGSYEGRPAVQMNGSVGCTVICHSWAAKH